MSEQRQRLRLIQQANITMVEGGVPVLNLSGTGSEDNTRRTVAQVVNFLRCGAPSVQVCCADSRDEGVAMAADALHNELMNLQLEGEYFNVAWSNSVLMVTRTSAA